MAFPGLDKMKSDAPAGGAWIKMVDDEPVRVTVMGYVGTTSSKKYPDKVQYRFEVADESGALKKLDCNFRLMKLIQEIAEKQAGPFAVTITQRKVIAEIVAADGTKSKKLVNDYTLDDVKAEASSEVPF